MRTNRNLRPLRLAVAVVAALWAAPAGAAAPELIPVQGWIAAPDGQLVDGTTDLTVAIYDSETGGRKLYGQDFAGVPVVKGQFTVYLGADSPPTPLRLDLFRSQSALWVQITIAPDVVLEPRALLATAPWAAYAATCGGADTLQGEHAAGFARAGHSHRWNDVTGKPSSISDGDSDLIGALACTNNQVAKWSAASGTFVCADDADTTYAAGAGLAMSGANQLSIPAGGVTGTMLADNLGLTGTVTITSAAATATTAPLTVKQAGSANTMRLDGSNISTGATFMSLQHQNRQPIAMCGDLGYMAGSTFTKLVYVQMFDLGYTSGNPSLMYDTQISTTDWSCFVAGFQFGGGDMLVGKTLDTLVLAFTYPQANTWWINANYPSHNTDETHKVGVVCISTRISSVATWFSTPVMMEPT